METLYSRRELLERLGALGLVAAALPFRRFWQLDQSHIGRIPEVLILDQPAEWRVTGFPSGKVVWGWANIDTMGMVTQTLTAEDVEHPEYFQVGDVVSVDPSLFTIDVSDWVKYVERRDLPLLEMTKIG